MEILRTATLYYNALSWVFDHCEDLDAYERALRWIGLSEKEIEEEMESLI